MRVFFFHSRLLVRYIYTESQIHQSKIDFISSFTMLDYISCRHRFRFSWIASIFHISDFLCSGVGGAMLVYKMCIVWTFRYIKRNMNNNDGKKNGKMVTLSIALSEYIFLSSSFLFISFHCSLKRCFSISMHRHTHKIKKNNFFCFLLTKL